MDNPVGLMVASLPVPKSTTVPVRWLSAYVEQAMGLNPQQHAACFALANEGLQVLAGAGTGKTLLITARTLHLLDGLLAQGLTHAESRLLVLTFTDKAAQEMRERIHRHLRAAGYEGALPSASIVTFHTFCNQFLLRHGLSGGSSLLNSQRLTLLETAGQDQLHERLQQGIALGQFANIQTALAETGLDTLGVPVDVLGLAKIQHWPVPEKMALLASFAGLVEQIKSYGITPAEFLALVRTQTGEWTATAAFLPKEDPTTGLPIADKESLAYHWANHLAKWADPDWLAQAKEPNLPYGDYKKHLGDAYQESGLIQTSASRTTKVVWNPEDPPALRELGTLADLECEMAQAVAAYYAMYQQALRLQGAMDFNDLINETIARLSEDEALGARYVDWFEHVLVDEFQDTDGAQLRLLRLLLKATPVCNLTVVGDEKQSIYGFRFAQKENLSLIFAGYPAPLRVALQTNYRSGAPIVSVSNEIASQVTQGDPAQQLSSGVEQKAFSQGTAVTFFNLGRPLPPTTAGGKPKSESAGRLQERENQLITAEIVRLLTQEAMKPSDIAVLVPTHRRADTLASRLAEVGVPFLRSRDTAFFEEPTIRNAVALMRVIANPGDRQALVRLLNLRLSQPQLWQLLRWGRSLELPPAQWLTRLSALTTDDLPELDEPYRSALQRLAQQIVHWHGQTLFVHPLILMRQALAQFDLLDPALSDEQRMQESLTLRQFDGLLQQLIKPLGVQATLASLLAELELAAKRKDFKLDALVKDRTDSSLQAVRLMTFHASKGLEFEAVFVSWTHDATRRQGGPLAPLIFDPQTEGRPGFGLMWRKLDGYVLLKPMLQETIWAKPRRAAEAKRLFYVALTRAKQRLTVFRKDLASTSWTVPQGLEQLSDVTLWNEQDPAHVNHLEQTWLATPPVQHRNALAPYRSRWPLPSMATTPWSGATACSLARARPVEPVVQSVTGLDQLQRCPTQFWWQRLAQAPQPPPTNRPVLEEALGRLRGQLLHRAIEMAYRLPDSHPDQWLSQLWGEIAATSDLPPQVNPELEIARVRDIFQTFSASRYGWKAIQARREQVIAPELSVLWQTPLTVNTSTGAHPLVIQGRVDALFFNPDSERYTLVDFKTDARLSEGKRRGYGQQLALYQAALQANNPERQLLTEDVRLVHIPDGELSEQSLSELPHQSALSWLSRQLPTLSRVLSATQAPDPLLERPPCDQCGYAPLCPFVREDQVH